MECVQAFTYWWSRHRLPILRKIQKRASLNWSPKSSFSQSVAHLEETHTENNSQRQSTEYSLLQKLDQMLNFS